MVKTYFSLTKPGIIWGNLIAATGGFMLAAQGHLNWLLYLSSMLGVALVVASGCVFNNVIDADIDSKMNRTNTRAMVLGSISENKALLFATILGLAGMVVLTIFTNVLTLMMAAFGFYFYVVFYTLIYKRTSVHGTVVGSASGASPPVMGYLAVSNQFDLAAIIIFIGFCAWQMPHTYAIALFRKSDYQAIDIPLLPLVKTKRTTRNYMIFYVVSFLLAVIALYVYRYVGLLALFVMTGVCVYWLYQCIFYYKDTFDDKQLSQWGKKMFITSIFAITLFSIVIGIDYIPRTTS